MLIPLMFKMIHIAKKRHLIRKVFAVLLRNWVVTASHQTCVDDCDDGLYEYAKRLKRMMTCTFGQLSRHKQTVQKNENQIKLLHCLIRWKQDGPRQDVGLLVILQYILKKVFSFFSIFIFEQEVFVIFKYRLA